MPRLIRFFYPIQECHVDFFPTPLLQQSLGQDSRLYMSLSGLRGIVGGEGQPDGSGRCMGGGDGGGRAPPGLDGGACAKTKKIARRWHII